jgi:phosphopantetheinyl transferase
VFSVDLDQPGPVVERLGRMLPPTERDARPGIRVARAATRIVLADAAGIAPADVVISRVCAHCGHPTHGRPTFVGTPALSFSLSHSGTLAVIALVDGDVRVGVDVEELKDRRRLDALAERVLGADDHDAWLAIEDPAQRLRVFLQAWTAKEAYLKGVGIGITTRLRDVPRVVGGWSATELAVGDAHIGALAVDATDVEIRLSALPLFADR